MAAAAGGKRMATCFSRGYCVTINECIGVSAAHKDEEDVRSSERHCVQCSVFREKEKVVVLEEE
jgi:hypothetical protein